jgi:glucan biosynthesis protein C
MMLGIVFHAALPYDDLSPWVKDGPLSGVLGFMVLASHAFRLPLFFIMAGFFAALLMTRRSIWGFMWNRGTRIGIPLLVGWIVLTPLISAGGVFSLGAGFSSFGHSFDYAWALTKDGQFFFKDSTMHLWFLYYLLMFYAVVLLLVPAGRWVGSRHGTQVESAIVGFLGSRWRLPVLTVLTLAALQVVAFGNNEDPGSFTPDPKAVLFYGSFFAAGVLLFLGRRGLDHFMRDAWASLLIGIAAMFLMRLAMDQYAPEASSREWLFIGRTANALIICGMLFGLTGLLFRYMNRPMAPIRYVADASYWFYLIHLPLVAWLPGLLMDKGWAPELKFSLVLIVTVAVCFVTYELFVRWTYVGTLLQGRRYPSPLLRWLVRRSRPAPASVELTSA